MRALVWLERLHQDNFTLTGKSTAFPVHHQHRCAVVVFTATSSHVLALFAGVGYRLVRPSRHVLHRKLKLLLPLLYQFLRIPVLHPATIHDQLGRSRDLLLHLKRG